jgi:hypothetical protein
MKNKLTDLNDHLFAQLERLSDESLEGEKFQREIERSKAITGVGKTIVENARLALDAQRALAGDDGRILPVQMPQMLAISGGKKQ